MRTGERRQGNQMRTRRVAEDDERPERDARAPRAVCREVDGADDVADRHWEPAPESAARYVAFTATMPWGVSVATSGPNPLRSAVRHPPPGMSTTTGVRPAGASGR
jgi:hypothetical protein